MEHDPLKRLLAPIEDKSFATDYGRPVEQWNPAICGSLDIRIARDGQWFYHGSLIKRDRLVRLFSSILRKDQDGETYLVTPVEKVRIQVDDAPFLIVDIDINQGKTPSLIATTNIGEQFEIGLKHPLWIKTNAGEPRPYVRVRGRLDALVNRPCYYRLVDAAQLRYGENQTGLWIKAKDTDFCMGHINGSE